MTLLVSDAEIDELEKVMDRLPGSPALGAILRKLVARIRYQQDLCVASAKELDATFRWNSQLFAEIKHLRAQVGGLLHGLDGAIYDLERIRDADWNAEQMRLGAKSGARVARMARERK